MFEFLKEGGKDLELNLFDYIFGIVDLIGELMCLCINSVVNGDKEIFFEVCCFFCDIYDVFLLFGNVFRDVLLKLRVLKVSMNKVEVVCYMLKVWGLEIF